MNANKAQEYFSLYFEGELDGGLREQFERTLRQDAQVQAEYKAFVRTMQELEALKNPVPEPHFDLTEAISRRLDQHFYELDRKPANSMWTLWKKVAVGAIATIAIVGATASIWNANRGPAQAGVVPSIGNEKPAEATKKRASMDASKLDLKLVDDKWTFTAKSDEPQTITIQTPGATKSRIVELGANDELTSELTNSETYATVVEVKSSLTQNPVWIAVPGNGSGMVESKGQGSIAEFAASVSGLLKIPVIVVGKQSSTTVQWEMGEFADASSLADVVAKYGYSVEEKENGVIWIL